MLSSYVTPSDDNLELMNCPSSVITSLAACIQFHFARYNWFVHQHMKYYWWLCYQYLFYECHYIFYTRRCHSGVAYLGIWTHNCNCSRKLIMYTHSSRMWVGMSAHSVQIPGMSSAPLSDRSSDHCYFCNTQNINNIMIRFKWF